MSKTFNVANSRGSKPVLNDIKNAYLILSRVSVEFNDCSTKVHLIKAKEELWSIIKGEGYEINYNNKLTKRK